MLRSSHAASASSSPWSSPASRCSGDDSHKQTTMRARSGSLPPATRAAGRAAPTPRPPAATDRSGPTPLTEAMAAPYWTTPDELAGAQQFALEQLAGRRTTAFEAALRRGHATTIARRASRLMIGLRAEQLGDVGQGDSTTSCSPTTTCRCSPTTSAITRRARAYFAHKPDVAPRARAGGRAPTRSSAPTPRCWSATSCATRGDWAAVAAHYAGLPEAPAARPAALRGALPPRRGDGAHRRAGGRLHRAVPQDRDRRSAVVVGDQGARAHRRARRRRARASSTR